eukprot:TRINITY_DN17727_c0_g1_i1.p1 TRINITY_DN17727_c0_g1~~TRINITY_DN17727_c0_g1_i1.p1  ORF type:complete len:160 (+),score=8.45 TRINITY_DN17727_c0_g1_i1:112-591(+)
MTWITVAPLSVPLPFQQSGCLRFSNYISSNTFRHSAVTLRTRRRRSCIAAQKSDTLLKVVGALWKVGRDGIEAGSKLVPDSVPRPIARGGVAVGGLIVISFLLKSLLSTAFFIIATVGLIYLIFIYINKDEGPRGEAIDSESSIDETLDEARRIMDKYK